MAKFVYETELNRVIEKVIEEADEKLIIISPYIKLHDRIKSYLKLLKEKHELEITIVFGKNPDNKIKSLNEEDFNFLKEFPNIEIRYEERLHAKFFANEKLQVLSTMNLYDYSQDKNIEAGIVTEYSYLGNIALQLWNGEKPLALAEIEYFEGVIKNSQAYYENKPKYKKSLWGLSQEYTGSVSNEIVEHKKPQPKIGYCIRTGVEIPFDLKKPYTDKAFESWSEYKNKQYKERFCHYSGEASNGETSFERPILKKNWKKAQEIHGFNK